jgi:predicted PurR-regulated permease PerM/methylmalonyl-CoA mutase cobalamin-binding subunit
VAVVRTDGAGSSVADVQSYFYRLAAVVLTIFAVSVAKPVLVPLALAILLAFVLSPIVSWVQRLGLGRVAATLATVLLAFASASALTFVIVSQFTALARELPQHKNAIEAKLERLRGSDGPFSRVAKMVQELATPRSEAGAGVNQPVRIKLEPEPNVADRLEPVVTLLEPVATGALVVVLMVFVLLGREDLRSRLIASLGRARLIGTVRAIEDSTDRVGRYLLMQLMVNAALGAAFGAGLLLMGVPYALLWAVLMALFRFIPFVGTWVAVLSPLALSFATSPDWGQPLMILGYFAMLDLITANVLEPLLFGHHTGVSPIALLTAAAFWAWVWGPVGLLLSTPLTVCLAVVGQHFAPVRALGLLLGDKRGLALPIEFYQRVLTDGAAAGTPVAVEAAVRGRVAACDAVLIPALALARNDRVEGSLTPDEELEVQTAVCSAMTTVMASSDTVAIDAEELAVVGLPAHVAGDEIPLAMLRRVIEDGGGRMTMSATRMLPGEMVRQVAAAGAAAVVISSLPPGGLPQTTFLCEQVRERHPDLLIVVARWGHVQGYDELLVELRRAGASYLTTSLQQTVAQLLASAGRARPAVPAVATHE